jgi:hypothetical protein
LIITLKGICASIDGLQDELCQLLPTLLAVDLIAEAKDIHDTFEALLTKCQAGAKHIWPEFLKAHDLPGPIFETVSLHYVLNNGVLFSIDVRMVSFECLTATEICRLEYAWKMS